jgi:hypothetical protein
MRHFTDRIPRSSWTVLGGNFLLNILQIFALNQSTFRERGTL